MWWEFCVAAEGGGDAKSIQNCIPRPLVRPPKSDQGERSLLAPRACRRRLGAPISTTIAVALVLVLAQIVSAVADMADDAFDAYRRGDFAIAAKLWRPLAEQGDATAQAKMGLLCEMGRGVPKDDVEAAHWYLKAAEQGVVEAQTALGFMYSAGQGVAKDTAKAMTWYRSAAGQGYPAAQYSLGLGYASGEGVPRDNMLAYMWFYLAAKQNHQDARHNRDNFAPLLTHEEVLEAENMAQSFMVENH